MDKFYELRNFMNAWSPQQEQQQDLERPFAGASPISREAQKEI